MFDDRELVRRSLDFEKRSNDYRMMDFPGYMDWSQRKLGEGESEAYIAYLDVTSVWLLPEDAAKMTEKDFDVMLEEFKADLEKGSM